MSQPPPDFIDYCDCGEYLGNIAKKPVCDDPTYGCKRPHRGLYCTNTVFHSWVGGSIWDTPEACAGCGRIRYDLFIKDINYQRRDRAYWVQVFKDLEAKTYLTKMPRDLTTVEDIRLRRYEKRLPQAIRGQDPVTDYGEKDGEWLALEIQSMHDDVDDPCINNTRFAAVDVRKDMRRYRKAKSRGCCGYYDERVQAPSGRIFIIGCNYGH